MKNKFFILFILLVFVGGCAKTVTLPVTLGEQMIVTVTMRGTIDVINSRYFLVLSSASSLKIPLPDNVEYEMIEPGTEPVQGSEEAYYTDYYSTWSGYLITDPSSYYLIAGPFVQSQTTTRESLDFINQINNTLTYSFDLSKIFGSTIPDDIYFDVVSVDWPNGQKKMSQDHLTSTNAYISGLSGSIVTIDDGIDSELAADLDIISCKAEIE